VVDSRMILSHAAVRASTESADRILSGKRPVYVSRQEATCMAPRS
jgi:hypothetical protein